MKNAPASGRSPKKIPENFETREIRDLKPHPDQDRLFRPISAEELETLKASMRAGLRIPIEITEDDMVIDGHRRLRAARALGWETITVEVRRDLRDREAVDRRHVEANRDRRQLDVLDQVRLVVRDLELERRRSPGGPGEPEAGELRDRVGARIKQSGRNVQRYLNILNAPMEIQEAFSSGRLPMTLAQRFVGLSKPIRREILAEIKAGADPGDAVKSHLPRPARKEISPGESLGRLVTSIAAGMDALVGREGEIRRAPDLLTQDLKALRKFEQYIQELRPLLKCRRAEARAEIEEMQIETDIETSEGGE